MALSPTGSRGSGGGLPDPITDPVTIATTDVDVIPETITTPDGFGDGDEYRALLIQDSDDFSLFRVEYDGTIKGAAQPGSAANAGVSLYGDPTGTVAVPSAELAPGHSGAATSLRLFPADSQPSYIELWNATGNVVHHLGTDVVGFFGATPAARPVVPLTSPTVQDVIAALIALGLVSQSD